MSSWYRKQDGRKDTNIKCGLADILGVHDHLIGNFYILLTFSGAITASEWCADGPSYQRTMCGIYYSFYIIADLYDD